MFGGILTCCVFLAFVQVFPQVWGYTVHVPSFTSEWGFNLAVKTAGTVNAVSSAYTAELDARMAARELGDMEWYDSISHCRMFSLGKPVRPDLASTVEPAF
jgi:hypothetical protein